MHKQLSFVFPVHNGFKRGCLHVSEHGCDGYLLNGTVRVCGSLCAEQYARGIGEMLVAEHFSYGPQGKVITYVSEEPKKHREAKE